MKYLLYFVSSVNVSFTTFNSLLISWYVCAVAASLTALFKHIGSVDEPTTDEVIREKVLSFIRDKVRGKYDQCHLQLIVVNCQ